MSGVRLRVAGASDVGQLRRVNQDSMLLGPLVFAVADGMGGHAAGEVASQITVETIEAIVDAYTAAPAEGSTSGDDDEPTGPRSLRASDLVTAIQAANDEVFARSAEDPELAGMGTTIVAIALIEEDDETRLAIFNVGDSRAYRLADGKLGQISDDHSLVGELVRDGRITPTEARSHPQKNIVNRAIGIDQYVDVDDFQILPRRGDRYLLCSDGLNDELDDDAIGTILRDRTDPQDAADALVRAANEHGGRDNITVVVVDVIEDDLTEDARAALPDDVSFSHHPDADTQGVMAVPDDQAHRQNARDVLLGDDAGDRPIDPLHDTGEFEPIQVPDAELEGAAKAPRVVTVRSLGFAIAVLVLVGGGLFLAYNYGRNTFHVGVDDAGEVTIYRGRVGGFWWFDPTMVAGTGIDVDDLPDDARDDVLAGVSQPTRGDAERYVENLEDRIAELTPPVTTTTTTTRPLGATADSPPPGPTTSTRGG